MGHSSLKRYIPGKMEFTQGCLHPSLTILYALTMESVRRFENLTDYSGENIFFFDRCLLPGPVSASLTGEPVLFYFIHFKMGHNL